MSAAARRDSLRAFVRRDPDRPRLNGRTLRLLADEVDMVSDEVFGLGSTRTAYCAAEQMRMIAEDVDLRPFSGSVAQAITIRAELAEKRLKDAQERVMDAEASLARCRKNFDDAQDTIATLTAGNKRLLGMIAALLAQLPAQPEGTEFAADVVIRAADTPSGPALTLAEWHAVAVQIAKLRAQGSQSGAGGDEKLR
jgi:hypothetical protein